MQNETALLNVDLLDPYLSPFYCFNQKIITLVTSSKSNRRFCRIALLLVVKILDEVNESRRFRGRKRDKE